MSEQTAIPLDLPRRTAKSIARANHVFYASLIVLGATYILLIVLLVVADAGYMLQQTFNVREDSWLTLLAHNPIRSWRPCANRRFNIWFC